MVIKSRFAAFAAVLGMALCVLLPGAAAAEPSTRPASAKVSVTYSTIQSEDARCYTQLDGGGPFGGVICNTVMATMYFQDGTKRKFIIGWDRAVWNIAQYPNGVYGRWLSLGGWAQQGVWGVYNSADSLDLLIWTIGRDGRQWCRDLYGTWGPWGYC